MTAGTSEPEKYFAQVVLRSENRRRTIISTRTTGTKPELIAWAARSSTDIARSRKFKNKYRKLVLTFQIRSTGPIATAGSMLFGVWSITQVIRANTKTELIQEAARVSPDLVRLINSL